MTRGPTLPIIIHRQRLRQQIEQLRREHAEVGARLAALEGEFFLLKQELGTVDGSPEEGHAEGTVE